MASAVMCTSPLRFWHLCNLPCVYVPCIRLERGKFESTNQDSAGEKILVSWCKVDKSEKALKSGTFLTGDGVRYPRKGIFKFKNQTELFTMWALARKNLVCCAGYINIAMELWRLRYLNRWNLFEEKFLPNMLFFLLRSLRNSSGILLGSRARLDRLVARFFKMI